jgi:hypothetical protein
MRNEPHPDAVVLRFTPMSPEGVLKRAGLDARRSSGKGHHTASVWFSGTQPKLEDAQRFVATFTKERRTEQ